MSETEKKRGVGTIIREALLARKTNEEALEAVKAELPDANTSASTVSWYRNAMRKEEPGSVPTARELKKERKAAEAAAAPAEEPEGDPLEE